MKIFRIEIDNFRLLKSFQLDLEDELSLIIGKNNTGKTSILTVLDKFLNHYEKLNMSFNDFNVDFKTELKKIVTNKVEISYEEYKDHKIELRIFIKYDDKDNLANINQAMMDLNPDNNVIVLGFAYYLSHRDYINLREKYFEFDSEEAQKTDNDKDYNCKDYNYFMENKYRYYFKKSRKSYKYIIENTQFNEDTFIDIDKEKISIKEIINFKYISAKRDVTNKDIDKTLSKQTAKVYRSKQEKGNSEEIVEKFKDTLHKADEDLNKVYLDLFKPTVDKIQKFGGIKENESLIEIISNLQHKELLEGNTTVMYTHDSGNKLPENYNGLGYMNLICMIFEIEILLHEFKQDKNNKPADINLLFIEEPEAHTHPQMQYIFIKNIKALLKEGMVRDDELIVNLQSIISTHSSHIVADSEFDDIKYLFKMNNSVSVKNLKDLKKEYKENTEQYEFLKQYLTINRAEVFFADKAVFIEGDTERILIPTIMKKLDIEEKATDYLPLLSQNISIIEVGAYSQIFDKFIQFLNIKTLIITDIDSVKMVKIIDKNGKDCEKPMACRVDKGTATSNSALKYFFNNLGLNELINRKETEKILEFKINKKDVEKSKWEISANGTLHVVYQTEENGYHARSFEDSFIQLNRDFIKNNIETFTGLKHKDYFDNDQKDAYDLAENCISKKTHFALDIIYNSNQNMTNWRIPSYIREGLLWLQKD